jgi:hypothetical protein
MVARSSKLCCRKLDPWLSPLHQEIDTSGIMVSLQPMSVDVLFLLQTCWSGGILSSVQPAAADRPDPHQNRVEIIASCGYKQSSPVPGSDSFCSTLVEELRSRAESNATFNTAQLYRGVYRCLLGANHDLRRTGFAEFMKPFSPIHISLDENAERASIPLKVIRRNGRPDPWVPSFPYGRDHPRYGPNGGHESPQNHRSRRTFRNNEIACLSCFRSSSK